MRPAPLVPAEVDLRSLEYMPLYVAQLTRSKAWKITKRRPELMRPLLALWLAAWQSVPAGSLEADDDELSDAADLTAEQWRELGPDLIRGWVHCSDGRFYLASMVPMVLRGWALVAAKRKAGKAGAKARWGTQTDGTSHTSSHSTSHPAQPVGNIKNDSTSHASAIARPDSREGGSKGVREIIERIPAPVGSAAHLNGGAPTRYHNRPHDPIGETLNAWHQAQAAAAAGTEPDAWEDPRTPAALQAIGGLPAIASASPESLKALQRDFSAAFTSTPTT